MDRRSRAALLVLLLSAATVLASCGQTREERVRQVAETYADAVLERDFATVCSLLGWTYRENLGGTRGCIGSQRVQWAQPPSGIGIPRVRSGSERGVARLSISRPDQGPSPLTLLFKKRKGQWVIIGQR